MRIVVVGMHRSGTSAVTGTLHRMGAFVGAEDELTPANQENPKGFYERRDIRAVCDGLLQASGATWWNPSSFHVGKICDPSKERHVSAFMNIVGQLDPHRPWAIKEPRLCLVLPLLRDVLQHAVAVIVHRDPVEIALSLRERNELPIAEGVALWESYMRHAIAATTGMTRIILRHRDLMAEPVATAEHLLDRLPESTTLSVPREAIEAFISGNLYRQRSSQTQRSDFLNRDQLALASALDASNIPEASEY